jgi:hypothetical protein
MRHLHALVGSLHLCAFLVIPSAVTAQDLFELEVFEYESTPPGRYEVEFHTHRRRR